MQVDAASWGMGLNYAHIFDFIGNYMDFVGYGHSEVNAFGCDLAVYIGKPTVESVITGQTVPKGSPGINGGVGMFDDFAVGG